MPDISPKAPPTYQLHVEGMTCQHCISRVEKALEPVDGVSDVQVSLENNRVTITGGLPHQAVNALNSAGYPATPYQPLPGKCDTAPNATKETVFTETNESYRIKIREMTCASCVGRVEKAILSVDNVKQASINL
ncbi:MAG: copper ion binding protein, partial [Gammaproteobacteria bacterium]